MTALRLVTYNVEWFNALFDDAGRLLDDAEPSARYGVTRGAQLAALGAVFRALDADGVMVIEAPNTGSHRSTVTALETFAAQYSLRTRRAVIGYVSDTEQEIAFLYDPDRLTVQHDPQGAPAPKHGAAINETEDAPRFDSQLRLDVDGDGNDELVRFSKPPLELLFKFKGQNLRLIGVHAKSKAAHGAADATEFIKVSIDNRRKQLVECLWLRERVSRVLAAGESLIVLGDLNDGPGLDEYEKQFGRSGVEIVLGVEGQQTMLFDPHASLALAQPLGLNPTTARFYSGPDKRFFEALIDFIMVSPDLAAKTPKWRIWHPFDDPKIASQPDLANALISASDHFPVTIDLTL